MGGNSSYSKGWGDVPNNKRTHEETGYLIDCHKVLLTKENYRLSKNILNSNSANATYIIAKKLKDGTIQAHSINIFDGHNLKYEINLVFDSNGNIVSSYNNGKGSHAHLWSKYTNGILRRVSHDKSNSFHIDSKYEYLIEKIIEFNNCKVK